MPGIRMLFETAVQVNLQVNHVIVVDLRWDSPRKM